MPFMGGSEWTHAEECVNTMVPWARSSDAEPCWPTMVTTVSGPATQAGVLLRQILFLPSQDQLHNLHGLMPNENTGLFV